MPPYWRLSAWYFFYFAFIGAFAPYFTLYLQSLGQTAFAIGVLMSLMQVMRLLAPNLWGWLADRLGHKVAIIRLSAALALAGFATFFFAREFTGLFIGMALMAFFWSASLPLVEALTLDQLKSAPDRYGRIRLWGSVGFIAAVTGSGVLLDAAGLPALLWICSALLAGILGIALLLDEPRSEAPPVVQVPLGPELRRPAMVAFLLACFFMSAAHGPFYFFYSIHLVDAGYGKTLVGALWSLGVVAEIFVFIYMPRLLQHFSLRAILLASFALAVLRFLLIGWAVESLLLLLLAQLMHGATFGAFHAGSVAVLNRWFPPQQQARVQAIYGSISFGAGGMLGGLLAGQTWDSLGAELTFTIGAGFAAIGWILLWRGMHGPAVSAVTAP
ncbi:MAG: MFS transporter [Gammaproteobacteria bacterium]|nr:MFS transporter [Gammaproteobacteria bacterium]MBU1646364.1 MFS transporter [Gammaproteobacteria bacterium]MBU1970907.1 MFS transporter [Gammaproteobacteria bacterium]